MTVGRMYAPEWRDYLDPLTGAESGNLPIRQPKIIISTFTIHLSHRMANT